MELLAERLSRLFDERTQPGQAPFADCDTIPHAMDLVASEVQREFADFEYGPERRVRYDMPSMMKARMPAVTAA
jgi:hypothetical protein